jgi:ribosome-interacting GTPase 1
VFREAVWRLIGLIRVYLRHGGEIDIDPVALRPPATVVDVAREIHHDLEARCRGARIWGPSARFDGQRVGRSHAVADGDVVEVIA